MDRMSKMSQYSYNVITGNTTLSAKCSDVDLNEHSDFRRTSFIIKHGIVSQLKSYVHRNNSHFSSQYRILQYNFTTDDGRSPSP